MLFRSFMSGRSRALPLSAQSPVFHLLQQARDEAHRFAITAHRQQRGKKRTRSVLEDIPGIGNKRRQALLRKLGGLREVARAGVEDLSRVPGISPALAQRIYEAVLKAQPKNPDALHLLGVLASQTKQYERAVELIDKAIAIHPKAADRKSTRLNSSHPSRSRMPSSA